MKGGGKKKTLGRELVGSSSFLSRGRASLVNEGRPLGYLAGASAAAAALVEGRRILVDEEGGV